MKKSKEERLKEIKNYFGGLREKKTSGIVEGFDVSNLSRNADKGMAFSEEIDDIELGDYVVVKRYVENSYGYFTVGQLGRITNIVDFGEGKVAVHFDTIGEDDMFVGYVGKDFVLIKFDKEHIISKYSKYSFRELQFAVLERVLNYLLLTSNQVEEIEDLVDLRNEIVYRRRCS